MPAPKESHSHRSTTKVTHKAFKSKKATKGALRDQAKGKTAEANGSRKTPHQQVLSKLQRRNRAKQLQLHKRKEHQRDASIFQGKGGAPRIVAVVPLCANASPSATIRSLNASLDIESDMAGTSFMVQVDRFRQKLQYIPLQRNLTACLDATRVADFIIFILSAQTEVDALGELIIRSIGNQGMSTLFTVVQDLDQVEPAKARPDVVKSLASFMVHFHPEQNKVYNLDSQQECSNLMRSLCSTPPKGVNWRDQRSWMLVDDVRWFSDSAVLTGIIRGQGLKADRLVHITDWGTFQIEKITSTALTREEDMSVDEEREIVLAVPGFDQEDLAELAPEEVTMRDAEDDISMDPTTKKGVLLDDHHYFSEDEAGAPARQRKVPEGTSAYQSAWYLEDVSDSESEDEDQEMRDADADADAVSAPAAPEDGMEGIAIAEPTEAAMSEYPQSEKFKELDEEDDALQLEAYRSNKRDEAKDDLEFPDEIELHPHVLARERLAKYRGLKSLRSSPWNKDEDKPYEPEEWPRLLHVSDYKSSRNRAIREALVGGVAPGTRVHVYLKGVPAELQASHNRSVPVTLFSLLRHENKKTALNFEISHKDDYELPIKAKEELIVQCGPRRFVVNPQFSLGGKTVNNVHKYCRFLHPGQSAVASFTGPITWGTVPTLFFKRTQPEDCSSSAEAGSGSGSGPRLHLVATGTTQPPSTSRVMAKRAILTGHPYHIHKKIVTIRYMFFNREDVEWFKALPLWTRRGRSGYIREPLGTHGYFKANFDGRINPQDSVGVSLYKRVWPRSARPLTGQLLEGPDGLGAFSPADEEAMDVDV